MLSEEKKLLKRKFLIKLKRQRMLQIFAWAGLVYILIFNYAPMAGILVAFKKFSIKDGFMGIFTNEWVGLKYFIEFFNDYMSVSYTHLSARETLSCRYWFPIWISHVSAC